MTDKDILRFVMMSPEREDLKIIGNIIKIETFIKSNIDEWNSKIIDGKPVTVNESLVDKIYESIENIIDNLEYLNEVSANCNKELKQLIGGYITMKAEHMNVIVSNLETLMNMNDFYVVLGA